MTSDRTQTHADEQVYSPIDGMRVPIGHVADPVFAFELLGSSVAIEPCSSTLAAPMAGSITFLSKTRHVIGITSDAGAELLIHAGIDTILLKGAPFSLHVAMGDRVEVGDALMEIDLAAIEEAGMASTIIVIVADSDDYSVVEKIGAGLVQTGDELMRLIV
ncbi:PTS glucose transporter subunit IIA [Coriobacteriales bacterium OH1046]|nr:PTS glucose transporter subunit IIA [Coriobacteriales bacterium OH1046]